MAFNPHCNDCVNSGYVCRAHTNTLKSGYSSCKDCSPLAGYYCDAHRVSDDESMPTIEPLTQVYKIKPLCECGSHAVGYKNYTPFHSHWCPAFKKE